MHLQTDSDKRRLLTEVAAVQQYNRDKDQPYQVSLRRQGMTLIMECLLQPTVNPYRVRFVLGDSYPASPPEITLLDTPPAGCPHLLSGNHPCLFRGVGSGESMWDPSRHTAVFAILCTWRWLLCLDLWVTTRAWGLPDAAERDTSEG